MRLCVRSGWRIVTSRRASVLRLSNLSTDTAELLAAGYTLAAADNRIMQTVPWRWRWQMGTLCRAHGKCVLGVSLAQPRPQAVLPCLCYRGASQTLWASNCRRASERACRMRRVSGCLHLILACGCEKALQGRPVLQHACTVVCRNKDFARVRCAGSTTFIPKPQGHLGRLLQMP